jgi:PAS domain S-box-containing protein/hemerythrin-like metal-binding protein
MKHSFQVSSGDTGVSSLRGLRTRYIFVLAVVGILSVSSYLLLGMTLHQQDTRAAEINMAGRQRMLSQRIGLLQARFREARSEAQSIQSLLEMSEAVGLMEKSHIALTTGNADMGISPPSSQALKSMYFGPELMVDMEVRLFLDLARQYMQAVSSGHGVTSRSLRLSADSSITLLSHLDRIVGQYQIENEKKVAQIQILRHLTAIFTLGVLLFSGLLVFRPMVSRIHRNVAELAAAEERFRSITLSSRVGMVIGEGEEGRIAGWNPAAEDMFGYKNDEILGQKISWLIPERFRAAHEQGYKNARKTGQFSNGLQVHQLMALHKDGHEFPIELSLGSWEKSGKTFFSGIVTDISERLKSRAMTDRLGRIIENATNEFFLFDAKTLKFVFVNAGGLKNLGYKIEEVLDLSPSDLVVGFERSGFEKTVELLRSGDKDIVNLSETMIRADGSTYDADVAVQFMHTESPPLFLIVVNDVSDRVMLEQSLRRSQKLEAVGQLAGGIAHDFNNLLGIILGNLEMLSRKSELDERNNKRIATSLKATRRAADLTKQILGFSRQSPTNTLKLNVNDVVRGMQSLIEQSAGRHVEVEFKLQDDLWSCELDQGDLEDAIVNLCVNAGHAMPEGGKLIVECINVEFDAEAEVADVRRGKEYVALNISDSGEGISKSDQEKIFEPFFTTKEKGLGTGLGLAMVFGFVHRSKGEVRVYSELGHGTKFSLYLPRSYARSQEREAGTSDKQPVIGGTETILVVDDEEELADVAAEYLRSAGYKVLVANSAEAALLLVQQMKDLALVFTDVVMPGGMNGFQFAVKIFQTRPEVKVLLTSGFAWEGDKEMQSSVQFVKYCVQEIVRKPYREFDFLTAVRLKLDSEALIPWSEDLETGVPSVDEDHRLLSALVNLANVAVERSENEDKILAIIGDLAASAIHHFDREEVIMEVVDYPDRDAQMVIHKSQLSKLMRYMSNYETSNDIQDAQVIVDFLDEWLAGHIGDSRNDFPALAKGRYQEIRMALEDKKKLSQSAER